MTFADAASLLQVTQHHFMKHVYQGEPRTRYREFKIQKRGPGCRTIKSPNASIMKMQQSLRAALQPLWTPHDCVHGYRTKRTILTNAKSHLGRRWLLNIDLKDFFGAITFARVYGLLQHRPYQIGQKAAAALAQLATDGLALAQGSPSSPLLSNMVCHRLDKQLTKLARELRCTFTRYADDLTFSSRHSALPPELVERIDSGVVTLGKRFLGIVQRNGFLVNERKVWFATQSQRQQVTGLIVNDRTQVRVPSLRLRKLRAALHNVATKGLIASQVRFAAEFRKPSKSPLKEPQDLYAALRGHLEFVRSVYGDGHPTYENLAHAFVSAFPHRKQPRLMSTSSSFDIFLSHASLDKEEFARPLREALKTINVSCWFDEEQIPSGAPIALRINDGIRRSKLMVVLVTPSFLAKQWTQTEMGVMLHQEITRNEDRLLPVVTKAANPLVDADWPLLAPKNRIAWASPAAVAASIKSAVETAATASAP